MRRLGPWIVASFLSIMFAGCGGEMEGANANAPATTVGMDDMKTKLAGKRMRKPSDPPNMPGTGAMPGMSGGARPGMPGMGGGSAIPGRR